MELVWFKRDLRVFDHEPLSRAASAGEVVALYVIEPEYWQLPDTSARQWLFLRECLIDLRQDLLCQGVNLQICRGAVTDIFTQLHRKFGIDRLWSHEETGNLWTFERDIAVGRWVRSVGVEWTELPQHGVVRRLDDRDRWASSWEARMGEAIIPALEKVRPYLADGIDRTATIPKLPFDEMHDDACLARQAGGRTEALQLLKSFLTDRGSRYQKEMSSPLTAQHSCSRLSAHIAFGTLSIREVSQAVTAAQKVYKSLPVAKRGGWGKALSSYAARLHWHCHFIQKLEDDPSHEVNNVHSAYAGMREETVNRDWLQAWAKGQTGFPFIDACMRSLIHSGWINFRMRAMLLSFACYQLWLHWREPGLHLARLFVDYEPGIHWNQVQMQSGTTGINTVRMYNPVKQSVDQDLDGVFIRTWVPELTNVDNVFIHEPWKMSMLEQQMAGCIIGRHYPEPIVDHLAAARVAREKVHAVRSTKEFRREADGIQQRHGSRKKRVPSPAKRKVVKKGVDSSTQMTLDF